MNINRDVSSYVKPYSVILFDATDAYYYADLMDTMFYVEKDIDSLELAKKIADSLFILKNYKWESLKAMNDVDGGYDVRVFDVENNCVYAAHEKYKDQWIV